MGDSAGGRCRRTPRCAEHLQGSTWLANVRRAVGVTVVTHALLRAVALGGPLRFEHAGVSRRTSMSFGELIIRR